MKRTVIEKKKKTDFYTIMEEYNNFNEFITVNNHRPVVWTCGSEPQREDIDPSFTGCKDFAEAQELLRHGCNENVDWMVKQVNALQKNGTRVKKIRYADVHGYAPIVPHAIIGLPCSMMNEKKKVVKDRVITIVYDVNVVWYVTPKQILDFGCRLLNCALNLERSGYRVKIDIASTFNYEKKNNSKRQYIVRIPIKNENQPLNVKRVSFAMTHSAMLRYLAFDWVERLPGSEHLASYGTCIQNAPKCLENVRNVLDKNEVLVHYGMDVEEMFGQKQ